ncbi:MAG: 2-C-methyl-D-erythritol 4-phosphate cytidylyltransferase [Candidatus Omnitrophica bacterium]|nr:2-C-methyl-D-erythritol 4-phosphate cytidylyltransferase [Candidatus Omnitrophota bacterium]
MKVVAIIAAAGAGRRLGRKKALLGFSGKPLIYYCLNTLNSHRLIDGIIIAAASSDLKKIERLVGSYGFKKVISVVKGGAARRDSVRNALKHLPSGCGLVLIHDAARPFVDGRTITALIKQAMSGGAAIAAVRVKSTIKRVNTDRTVRATIDRDELVEAQTPQVFDRELLLRAYRDGAGLKATDDSFLVERLGRKVKVVEGSYFNIKITTPEDLVFAKAILKRCA